MNSFIIIFQPEEKIATVYEIIDNIPIYMIDRKMNELKESEIKSLLRSFHPDLEAPYNFLTIFGHSVINYRVKQSQ